MKMMKTQQSIVVAFNLGVTHNDSIQDMYLLNSDNVTCINGKLNFCGVSVIILESSSYSA